MTKTATEVEVRRTATSNDTRRTAAPVLDEQQPRLSRKILVLAPLALLATSAAAYLVVRRWLRDDRDERWH